MSVTSKILTLTACTAVGVGTWTALPANAATPECGEGCISVFSSQLGTYADVNVIETVIEGGTAQVGQPVGLAPATGTDPSQDFRPGGATPAGRSTVSDFYAAGLVSAAANSRYGTLDAVQQRYAPSGVDSGLCVGVARVEQGEDLTLQPCDDPTTVWIVYPTAGTPEDYFAIVNAATTDFCHPFAMHLPRTEVEGGDVELQMQLRRLTYLDEDETLPASQVWGAVFGPQGES